MEKETKSSGTVAKTSDSVIITTIAAATNTTTTTTTTTNDRVLALSADDDNSTARTSKETEETEMKKQQNKKDKNVILVSKNKKPFGFYLNLAMRCIKQYNNVELSALGMVRDDFCSQFAIPTVVKISEILKRNRQATLKNVKISTVDIKDNCIGHFIQKAKIEVLLVKTEKVEKAPNGTG